MQHEHGGLKIRKYKVGSWVWRLCPPLERDKFCGKVWLGPYKVQGVDDTGHNVKLFVPLPGRGRRSGFKWIHTSNVKPVHRDSEGRLLLVDRNSRLLVSRKKHKTNRQKWKTCSVKQLSDLVQNDNSVGEEVLTVDTEGRQIKIPLHVNLFELEQPVSDTGASFEHLPEDEGLEHLNISVLKPISRKETLTSSGIKSYQSDMGEQCLLPHVK